MFALEVMGAFLPTRKYTFDADREDLGPITVVIPAHNEGKNILPTIEDVLSQLRRQDRLAVIADNCDDDTASIAREAGAYCLERNDTERRGKGYAIGYALEKLSNEPPEILMFFDADTRLDPGTCMALADCAHKTGRPAQSLNIMHAGENPSPRIQVAAFAWVIMNRVRMSGLFKIFGTTRMTGTGMAYPWPVIKEKFKGTGDIVEDLAFTMRLVSDHCAPILVHEVSVHGEFPSSEDGAVNQRARWEHGSLTLARRMVLPMFLRAVTRANPRALAMALDLTIPPLTMLIVMSLIMVILGIGFALISGGWGPFIVALLGLSILFVTIILSWIGFGRETLPLRDMIGIVSFVMEKFQIYGKSGRRSSQEWTRTERDK